ncbi:MAG: fibronectin type III domain-containing protein [Clostridia bacterium]|nr:fibronectin type III domain-containing protein [Clostridia bacterium]
MKKYIIFTVLIFTFLFSSFHLGAYAAEDASDLAETEVFSESEENKTVTDGEETEAPEYEEPPCRTEEVVSLDGKTVMMVGNSMLYYGNCVIYGDTGKEDKGYFYQLIAANGEEAKVIDHTYSGRTLEYIYSNHLVNISADKLKKVDYVVVAEANKPNKHLAETCKKIKALFPENTELIFMCNPMMYYNNIESLLDGVKDLRGEGIEIVDWGRLVVDIYTGKINVSGGKHKYDFCSFIKDNLYVKDDKGNILENPKGGDNKHPNPLSGYISAQMLYSSITNRSALYTDYSFCNDSDLNSAFDIDAFALKHYTGVKTTNFTDIFRSPADMFGIQKLIDAYLSEEGKHLLYVSDAVEPTCTAGGLSQGYFCSVCGETVREPEYIQSKGGHKIVYANAVAPTCTKAGKSGSAYCSVCKEYLIKAETISATGHSDTVVIKPATIGKDGRKIVNCTVCKAVISDTKIAKISSVELSKKEYVYDGKSKKPKITVKNSEGKILEKDKDYTVSYPSGRTAIGNYKVEIKFKGKYSGKETLTFKIRAGVTSSVSTKSYLNAVKLTWKRVPDATGYRIYLYNSKTKKYEKYADTKKTAINVKKLKSGTKYKFRVKAYTVSGGKTYYSGDYKFISAVTKPKKVTLKSAVSEKTGEIKLSWKIVSGANGYQVVYSESPKFKSAVKLLKSGSKEKNTVIEKLVSGKKYYFKVRAYKSLNGKKVYGPYSVIQKTVIK